jgi:hypothetical protein
MLVTVSMELFYNEIRPVRPVKKEGIKALISTSQLVATFNSPFSTGYNKQY